MQDINGPSVKVSIIGASGYTGAELLRLLLFHPMFEVIFLTSRQYKGENLTNIFPQFKKTKYESFKFTDFEEKKEKIAQSSHLVFCCLPHKTAFPIVKALLELNPKLRIIDFSADFRFQNPFLYENTYGINHTAKELFSKAAYGLPELYRSEIKKATIVANPGCYPTSIILGLYPAKKFNLIENTFPIIADSKSGVTGAGRKGTLSFTFCEINDNFKAYALNGHRHQPEMEEKLNLKIRFTPHLVPMNRGILSTIYFKTKASLEELKFAYEETYKNEPFIRLVKTPPQTSQVRGTNYCDIYLTKDEEKELGIVVSVIDNIGKGASGQAIQNANIVFNFPETLGLEQSSLWV